MKKFAWRIIDASMQQPRLESLPYDPIETEEQAYKEAQEAYQSIKDIIIGHAYIEVIGILGRYDAESGKRIYG